MGFNSGFKELKETYLQLGGGGRVITPCGSVIGRFHGNKLKVMQKY
jgi:hypothetical protein